MLNKYTKIYLSYREHENTKNNPEITKIIGEKLNYFHAPENPARPYCYQIKEEKEIDFLIFLDKLQEKLQNTKTFLINPEINTVIK